MFWVLSYITGGIVVVLSLLCFIFPKRKISLYLKASVDCVTGINALFILLATGNKIIAVSIVTNIIATSRDVLYMFRNKYKVCNSPIWPLVFASINAISLVFTYASPISLIPVIGSVISSLSLYANDQRITKVGALIAAAHYFTYYLILIPSSSVLTVFSLVGAGLSILGTTIGLINLLIKLKNGTIVQENVEVKKIIKKH